MPNAPFSPQPQTVAHVEGAFARISRSGDFLEADGHTGVPSPLYRAVSENRDGIQNHFQGIQRLRDNRYLVLSGGDWKNPKLDAKFKHSASHLVVVKLASRQSVGPCWSNVATGKLPPGDEVVNFIPTLKPRPQALRGTGYFHAVSPMASTPYKEVCMTIFLIQKGRHDTTSTELELDDLPLDFSIDASLL